MMRWLILFGLSGFAQSAFAQPGREKMPASTLPEQAWWNVLHYSISIRPDFPTHTLTGTNTIAFRAVKPGQTLLLDLLAPMTISSVSWQGKRLSVSQKPDGYLVGFPRTIAAGERVTIAVAFKGHPKEAVNPPWDGGWIWSKDSLGRPWVSLACESPGGMLWLPCKNASYDEPDSGMTLSITVPDTLVGVGNGRLIGRRPGPPGWTTWDWKVANPINNYDICPYIGKYVTWHHDYPGLAGRLDCDYWVIDYHREKAERHLRQVDTLLACFEYWMGPYPFYGDGYKIVESPMAGMEHQSAIAYGNGFEDGYRGKNLSGTPWGLKWDFILVHESGHEWFGNSISANSWRDGWIHEGFTKYLETLYTTWIFGTGAGNDYTLGIWKRIKNDAPIIGSGSTDEYNKGCAMLHMIRQIVGDTAFRKCLHDLNTRFYHSTVNTEEVLSCINRSTGRDFSRVFAQYLTTARVPVLEYRFDGDSLAYRWANCVPGFDMPVKVWLRGERFFISPGTRWRKIFCTDSALRVDRNFYVTAVLSHPD
ncbi:MAG TPA: M1 family metallopeptidase [Dinghuibacter sp.]|uniref:M1 family metallopeptidase n=1 Tax=Dinghuibacter sp. TaxID=2024697 RepID=UPI002CBCE6B7|nr:M1 family metallopeptidase [Dinghuibacter sp.]HTJ11295.1 M1 family metallopeptidase [Dinghuibacter sp.]